MHITHQRIEITKVSYHKACPYCKSRKLKRKTCGHPTCQYTHHILEMRKDRKTDQRRPSRTTSTIII